WPQPAVLEPIGPAAPRARRGPGYGGPSARAQAALHPRGRRPRRRSAEALARRGAVASVSGGGSEHARVTLRLQPRRLHKRDRQHVLFERGALLDCREPALEMIEWRP